MKQILVEKEQTSDGFNVYCKEEMFAGIGNTLEEAIEDMREQIKFHKKTCIDLGFGYPEFLDEPFELVIL